MINDILVPILLVGDILLSLYRLRIQKRRALPVTKSEREVLMDALDIYQSAIIQTPEVFVKHPLEVISDYVHEIDILKEKIK
jgi:hypothetical protein